VKRIVYVHEDCFFVTVHPSESTNIKDVEEEVMAKNFDEVNLNPKDSSELERLLSEIRN
jgi:hypothetical protein